MATKNTQENIKTVVVSPRVTEKAAILQDKGVYVFNVAADATKPDIARQIEAVYGVKPVNVTTARTASKPTFVGGRKGSKAGVKKAYVYLKDGDKITVQ